MFGRPKADKAAGVPRLGNRLFAGLSLRARLFVLVFASVMPLLLFSMVTEYLGYRTDLDRLSQRASTLARATGLLIEQMLLTRIAALEALARSRALHDGDVEAFRTEAATMVAQQFPGANIVLLRENGQQVMNLAAPLGASLPIRLDVTSTRRVFATSRPAVSNLFEGRVLKVPVIAIDVPIRRDDGTVYLVLSLNPRIEVFAEAIRRERLPTTWVVSVFDAQAINITRTLNPEQFVGRRAGDALAERLAADGEGTITVMSREGMALVTAFSPIKTFGWWVSVGVPELELKAPALWSAGLTLAWGAAVLLVSLSLALFVGQQISGPIASLRRLAVAPKSATGASGRSTGLRETDEVAAILVATEESRLRSEQQLLQSQKMEAIGNLTGGMAHDFNNLLGIIIGNLDFARPLLSHNGEAKELVHEAIDAALRGADLTKRLLAFARRQPLQPRLLQPNDIVADTVRLLRRTLGADLEVSLDLGRDVPLVTVDPAQLQAGLVNLATNARDAMPNGGRITITTCRQWLDADFAASHPEVSPGEYAVIEFNDTGRGMSAEVLLHVFEPFFTTKERGRGTGLGLSMVFGFVKQSGGHIGVHSEPGRGTTFRLYLPVAATAAAPIDDRAQAVEVAPSGGSGETVLAVDDDAELRRILVRQLGELGYDVRSASSAEAAVAILERERIDLLLTDVVMPGGANGVELARQVRLRWPRTKIVLTSGFPDVGTNGSLDPEIQEMRLLGKPYRPRELAAILREALDDKGSPRSWNRRES